MRWWRRVVGRLGYLVLRLIYLTIRVRVENMPTQKSFIIGFWHGQQLCLYGGLPNGRLVAPVSRSKDGELQVGVLAGFGIQSIRGSSSRGGVGALKGLIKALRRGAIALIAVDGPRGPMGVPKKGAFYLSERLGVPVYPVVGECSRTICLTRTWDEMHIPLPFSRIRVRFGKPLDAGPKACLDEFLDRFLFAMEELSSNNGTVRSSADESMDAQVRTR